LVQYASARVHGYERAFHFGQLGDGPLVAVLLFVALHHADDGAAPDARLAAAAILQHDMEPALLH